MKVFTFILAILVLGLSVNPCCTPTVKTNRTSVAKTDNCCSSDKETGCKPEQNKEDEACGSCSPFYTCGTCAGFVFNDLITETPVLIKEFAVYIAAPDEDLDSKYFASKWQPPKIS